MIRSLRYFGPNRRGQPAFLVIAAAMALAAGCGGGSSTLTPIGGVKTGLPTPTGRPATATPSATASAKASPTPSAAAGASTITATSFAHDASTVTQIDAYYDSLPHTSASSDAASVVSYMASLPQIATADGNGAGAWATFKDGLWYTMFLDQNVAGITGATPAPAMATRTTFRNGRSLRLQPADLAPFSMLPVGTAYVFSNSLAYGSVAPEMGLAQALKNAGYQAVYEEETIANLSAINNASLLYIYDHGNYRRTGLFPDVFAIATSDAINPQAVPTSYLNLLANNSTTPPQLTFADIPTGSSHTLVYAATNLFFTDGPVSFENGAFAFINTCLSSDAAFKAALQGKGVGTYIGWPGASLQADDRETANFLFDRLLGEQNPNVVSSFVGIPSPESPVERPFSLAEVAAYASTKQRQQGSKSQYAEDTSCSTDNPIPYCVQLQYAGNQSILLAPSLQLVAAVEGPFLSGQTTSQLYFQGEFSTTPAGTIMVGTSPTDPSPMSFVPFVNVNEGNALEIGQFPNTGPGSAGYVWIEQNGIAGNAVPLSEWGPIVATVTTTVPSQTLASTISGNLTAAGSFYIRGDMHVYRASPGASPQPHTFADSLELTDESAFGLLPQSTSSANVDFSIDNGSYTLTANGPLTVPFGQGLGGSFQCPTNLAPPCYLNVAASMAKFPQTVSPPCAPNDPKCPEPVQGECLGGDSCPVGYGYAYPGILIQLDSSYAIQAASGSSSGSSNVCQFGVDGFIVAEPGITATCTYSSSRTPAQYPPLSSTAG